MFEDKDLNEVYKAEIERCFDVSGFEFLQAQYEYNGYWNINY